MYDAIGSITKHIYCSLHIYCNHLHNKGGRQGAASNFKFGSRWPGDSWHLKHSLFEAPARHDELLCFADA